MDLRLVRKRRGRSYTYRTGGIIPVGWHVEDEKGNVYLSKEELDKAMKPKKTTAKKEG